MRQRAVAGFVIGIVVAGGLAVTARQSSLPKVGLAVKNIQTWATQALITSADSDSGWAQTLVPCLQAGTVKSIQALTAAERVALTQEVLAAVKAAVTTPAFRAQHAAYVKEKHGGVDHGVDVDKYGTTGDMDADAVKHTVVPIIDMMRGFPDEAIKGAYTQDRTEQAENIKHETGAEKAKAQKYLARLDAIAPLMKTNFAEFKNQYLLAKSASMGGPDTEAKLQAMTADKGDVEQVRLEQNEWNHWNLNEMIKKNLTHFVDLAAKFRADTRPYTCDNYDNPALDALMALLGSAPVNAAAQFSRAWLRELGK